MKKDKKDFGQDFEFWEDLEEDAKGTGTAGETDESEFDETEYEKSEYDEPEYDESDDLELEENVSLNPKKIALFCGLFLLAVLICIPLWMLTRSHLGKEEGNGGKETEQTAEASDDGADALTETNAAETQEGLQETQSGQTSDQTDSQTQQTQTQPPAESQTQPSESQSQTQGQSSGTSGQNQGQSTGTSGTENQPDEGAEPVDGDTSMSYTETGDSVTAKDVTNLRSAPSTSDETNVVGQLKNGETLKRKGMNENTGWSVLEYNGQTVYAVTRYLTTDLSYKTPVTPSNPNRVTTLDGRVIIFSDWDDYITPKEYVNLRTEPSTSEGDTTVRCQVNSGEKVHRTGYSQDSGWSRVEYNGEVLYVVTSLTTAVPNEEAQQ